MSTIEKAEDFQRYLNALEPYLEPYPTISLNQIQKLFPKNKKLKVPDLQSIDFRYVTYLGWVDIATNKLYIVYPFEGRFIGIEGRITPTNKRVLSVLQPASRACLVLGQDQAGGCFTG